MTDADFGLVDSLAEQMLPVPVEEAVIAEGHRTVGF